MVPVLLQTRGILFLLGEDDMKNLEFMKKINLLSCYLESIQIIL